ncbi:MAG: hypothetical protein RIB93_16535 [Coleofasciculus sp. D1-CHI-01]|uniref:hypothetical protein n=1 Tax=Coleofasciculus sp. D1-CHI-01 TaxID=3068482 RepID=UPI0032F3BCF5
MSNSASTIPLVDLVILMDTSPSMKDVANAVSDAVAAAIAAAETNCPADLRVVWLGIEGRWRGTAFKRTLRTYLTKECGVAEAQLRMRQQILRQFLSKLFVVARPLFIIRRLT